jgi:hypothetical protein
MNAEQESVQEDVLGSPEWAAEFKDAVKQAISEAVEEHLGAGNPVYFTDDEGDICELYPNRKIRKLSTQEVEQILSE